MAIAQRTGFQAASSEVKDFDASIILGSVALMIVFLIAIYLSFISGGTPGNFAVLPVYCQSAFKFDPVSASNFDPFERRVLTVALASSELAGVAETWRARVA